MGKTLSTISIKTLYQIINEEIRKKGFKPEKVKLAKAMCRDDSVEEVAREAEKVGYVNKSMGKNIMRFEALASVPTYGDGAVRAFYHHIPDTGVGIIIFATHYGIDSKGNIGYVEREGQKEIGKSCGANHTILGLWKENKFGPYSNNLELSEISRILKDDRKTIMESQEPIKTMAECEYTKFLEILKNYVISVQNEEHHKLPILIASGINIDRSWNINNEFILKGLTWIIDGKTSNANYKI